MGNLSGQFMLPAPGLERPDYTLISFPAANLTDTSSEEIELDQALSLAGRFGRDLLGVQVRNIMGQMGTEFLTTVQTADHEMKAIIRLATRTGSFSLSDPELLWLIEYLHIQAAEASGVAGRVFNANVEELWYAEPELYVAPRLFWRLENNIDATISADVLDARISSMSRRLNFRLFVELLERFADVTLL